VTQKFCGWQQSSSNASQKDETVLKQRKKNEEVEEEGKKDRGGKTQKTKGKGKAIGGTAVVVMSAHPSPNPRETIQYI
jgi:hypothetical protein